MITLKYFDLIYNNYSLILTPFFDFFNIIISTLFVYFWEDFFNNDMK